MTESKTNGTTHAQRDLSIDALRGIATLLVILGHTIAGSCVNYEGSVLFDVIWSLQMPLFFIISGYVTRYSRHTVGREGFGRYSLWKARTLLLPWAIWCVIRGLVNAPWTVAGQAEYYYQMIFEMERGYWFLFSLWVISMAFGVAELLCGTIKVKAGVKPICTALLMLLPCGLLVALGAMVGFHTLGIQLTLFYVPFFLIGYLFGSYREYAEKWARWQSAKDIGVAVCFIVWVGLILRYSIYALKGNLVANGIRVVASLAGCVTAASLTDLVTKRAGGSVGVRALRHFDRYSMEYYLLHSLVIAPVRAALPLALNSFEGALLVALNFALTAAISALMLSIIKSSRTLNRILFAR